MMCKKITCDKKTTSQLSLRQYKYEYEYCGTIVPELYYSMYKHRVGECGVL